MGILAGKSTDRPGREGGTAAKKRQIGTCSRKRFSKETSRSAGGRAIKKKSVWGRMTWKRGQRPTLRNIEKAAQVKTQPPKNTGVNLRKNPERFEEGKGKQN